MPQGKDPGPSIKRPEQYEALKEQGYSKEKAAKISNKAAQGPKARHNMAEKAARSRQKGTSRGKK
jgi:hypothetical protein